MVNLILQRLRTAELGEGGVPTLTALRPVVKRLRRWLTSYARG